MDFSNRQQLIQYLQSHGLYTKKKLGQNFLVDRGALVKIVDAAELSKNDCVIEVGAGLGTLTKELIGRAGKIITVELDDKLAGLLAERFQNYSVKIIPPFSSVIPAEAGILPARRSPGHGSCLSEDDIRGGLQIINQDILKINIAELIADCPTYKVVANIPYYITSKILRLFLEADKKPETIVLLTQKEVAERICAKPGEMSVLSVSVQYYGKPEIVGIVPRSSFFPAPEVDSAILRITNIQKRITNRRINKGTNSSLRSFEYLSSVSDGDFFRCVKIGFASRRKTLLNNLSAGYHLDKNQVLDILKKAGLTDKTRAQELSVEKWRELCFLSGQNNERSKSRTI